MFLIMMKSVAVTAEAAKNYYGGVVGDGIVDAGVDHDDEACDTAISRVLEVAVLRPDQTTEICSNQRQLGVS